MVFEALGLGIGCCVKGRVEAVRRHAGCAFCDVRGGVTLGQQADEDVEVIEAERVQLLFDFAEAAAATIAPVVHVGCSVVADVTVAVSGSGQRVGRVVCGRVLRMNSDAGCILKVVACARSGSSIAARLLEESLGGADAAALLEAGGCAERKLAASAAMKLSGKLHVAAARKRPSRPRAADVRALAVAEAVAERHGSLCAIEQLIVSGSEQEVDRAAIDALPCMGDERRLQYLKKKKTPQVAALLSAIRPLLSGVAAPYILDVGGGRGDFGLALARAFPQASVVVLDANSSSLAAANRAAASAGLTNLRTVCGDARELPGELITPNPPTLVVALHACGGLTDVALSTATQTGASFCVVPCCYASGASPGGKAVQGADSEDTLWPRLQGSVLKSICRLGELTEVPEIASRAARLINSARLAMVMASSKCYTVTQLRAFDASSSPRNQVLLGVVGK